MPERDDIVQLVTFQVERHTCAVDVRVVTEIIQVPTITSVVKGPPYIDGVVNDRGEMPVINLCKRLNIQPIPANQDTRVLIVGFADTVVGLVVNRISEVVRVSAEAIEPPSDTITPYFKGVVRREEEFSVHVLDLSKIIDINELASIVVAD